MHRKLPTWARLFAVLASFLLVAAACGDDDDDLADVPDVVEDVEPEEGVEGGEQFEAELSSLNDSGITGSVDVDVSADGQVAVSLQTSGFTGTNPHAQHFHIGGTNECPGPDLAGDDDLITTAEGQPAYGPVQVSLTTEGAVDAASALAVERFPVPSDDGEITYERTFELPDGVTVDDLADAVVVQHGFAGLGGDPAAYDGDAPSSLDPNLPLEATIPVACGELG